MTDSSDVILAEIAEDQPGLQPAGILEDVSGGSAQQSGLTAGQRKHRWIWLAGFAGVYLISLLVPRSDLPHIPICWLNATTGIPCPTCGLTRAFTEIGHGHLASATQLNVMAVPIFFLGLAIAGLLIYELWSGRNLLCPWAFRHRWGLISLAGVSVILRYLALL